MFGGSTSPTKEKDDSSPLSRPGSTTLSISTENTAAGRENKATSPSDSRSPRNEGPHPSAEHAKRRSSSMTKAANFFSNAKNSLHLSSQRESHKEQQALTPIQKLGKMDPALIVPQGSLNNSAGESAPTPRSSFRVGVTEDKNRKCRRTMEDTHAYLYNFLGTAAPTPARADSSVRSKNSEDSISTSTESDDSPPMIETDNGYFAIFDGHAGTFAAEWCGKKLHLILEDIMRKHPNAPVPELLDQAFTSVDQQLEKLPLKNSGCTAVTAVLRWEDRPTLSSPPAPPANAASSSPLATPSKSTLEKDNVNPSPAAQTSSSLEPSGSANQKQLPETTAVTRQRVLYTANVGDARVVLCRNGKALRLSYDHKGSDENEGKRISNAGGLILNNRVNGVLAVTRALGDSYMKDLVTGHPYTTETVIQPETDEFLILACDGLWDVCSDQEAVDLIRGTEDPQLASKILVDHALSRFSTDNLSCMIVRFDTKAIQQAIGQQKRTSASPPAMTDSTTTVAASNDTPNNATTNTNNNNNTESSPSATQLGGISEADKIVEGTRKKVAAGKLGAELGAATAGTVAVTEGEDENLTPVESFSAVEDDDELGPEVSPAELKGVIEVANLDLGGGRGDRKEGKKGGG
ncbi:protein phosphatase [Blastomyces parvus]|uniref:Protein phosphatase n=1 Tax=Blastomyces parvus TaxID=2060905 RepID=A0A2B7X493_9EURO|nr:protein phosphatase [Blastomyces parvus]